MQVPVQCVAWIHFRELTCPIHKLHMWYDAKSSYLGRAAYDKATMLAKISLRLPIPALVSASIALYYPSHVQRQL